MATAMVIGTQWGDEGKGKIVDYLAQKADVVIRSQGGNNAGHTVVVDDKSFALRLCRRVSSFPTKLASSAAASLSIRKSSLKKSKA